MSKTIRITTSTGDIRVEVANEAELDLVLQRNNATCFVDGEQIQIYGFDSLENDGSYTFGAEAVVAAVAAHDDDDHHQQQEGELLVKKSPRKRAPPKMAPAELTCKKKKKMGAVRVKRGYNKIFKSQAWWFLLCQKYTNSETSWKSQTAFLRSEVEYVSNT
jgi:hypothetical protein